MLHPLSFRKLLGMGYQASLNTLMIGPASDTGFGLVASDRSCRVAEAMNSSPSSGTPTSCRLAQALGLNRMLHLEYPPLDAAIAFLNNPRVPVRSFNYKKPQPHRVGGLIRSWWRRGRPGIKLTERFKWLRCKRHSGSRVCLTVGFYHNAPAVRLPDAIRAARDSRGISAEGSCNTSRGSSQNRSSV